MAVSDWFKADKNLPNSPKILRIAELTDLEPDTVLGRMWRFWGWVDDHVREDGRLGVRNVTLLSQLFASCDVTFWRALMHPQVAWLGEDSEGLFIPKTEKWFGTSRRERIANRERQKRYRDTHRNGQTRVTRSATKPLHNALDETRRDETRRDLDLTSSGVSNSLRASAPTSASASRAAEQPLPSAHDVAAQKIQNAEDGEAAIAPLPIDWEQAATGAREVIRKLDLRPRAGADLAKDRSLLLKAAALAQVLGERFLWDSVAAVQAGKTRRNKFAHLHAVMARKREESGGEPLNLLLKRLEVPVGLRILEARPP
jgi:hypothetical protein